MGVLVTGGAGYIGSHVVLSLVEAGETVIVVDDLSTGIASAVQPPAQLVRSDIAEHELLARLFRLHDIDAVLHFAGSIVVPESVADPLKYYRNNTAKSAGLIEVCVRHGVKHFIFSSTAAVYGESDTGKPLAEDAPLAPVSPYARSKLMTEWMLADTSAAQDFHYVALRYFNVAGADPKERVGQSTANATHLMKVASEAALGTRARLQIFGDDYPTPDGTCIRDFIHVSDLADAHVLALRHLRDGGASETFNAGYGHGYSVKQVVDTFAKVLGRKLPVEIAGRRPGDVMAVLADSTKLQRQLKWKPQHDDIVAIVSSALAWERRQRRRRVG